LTTTSNFRLDLSGLTGNLDARVYFDANNNGIVDLNESMIGSSTGFGISSESINLQGLQSGQYLVKLSQATTNNLDYSNYVLKLEANPIGVTNAFDDNSRSQAVNLGGLYRMFNNRNVTGFVGTSDTQDYYRFTVAENGVLNVNLGRLSADADLELISSTGAVIASSRKPGTASDFITSNITAGDYYIRVYQGMSGDTNYNLDLDFTLTQVNY
jgi:Bacterial pre-peptidase C-terminal domain